MRDDRLLFEHLLLDSFQAGLSWALILRKRENFREAFAGFEPERIARFGEREVEELLRNEGIIRNRLKVKAAIGNARAYLELQEQAGPVHEHVWSFVDGKTLHNAWRDPKEVPAKTETAEVLSGDLIKRGFRFVGPTIIYAFMQAVGMVNDHLVDCFRHQELQAEG